MNSSSEQRVSVSTSKSGDTIQIIIKENGTGIPEKVQSKISRPFFTTKLPAKTPV